MEKKLPAWNKRQLIGDPLVHGWLEPTNPFLKTRTTAMSETSFSPLRARMRRS